ncbi:type I restriction enzyme M protein [Mucilaginibacter sp. OK268]|uniref:type I restriction-modification system subunit M n=1 Tax=Mucilaginibacter sp. OK268 TaxID=1881048 RepID=UPI0008900D4F|nr:type I restriction-modification system subunit M [Mucilaginibacter sp. OK268]SDP94821.1 type I restriction enzyme M protein [Mucilaginibacter sp. OK268]
MAIKKSELYSSLWAGCDELRGSMDASQYKDYVLVMLFMKYVSDKVKQEKADGKTPIIDIPEGAGFYDMLAYRGKPDIGDKINKVIGEFAKANNLIGIIDEADFEDNSKLGSGKEKIDRLTNLLNIFNKPELDFSNNRAEGDDLLGDAYEYLMRHFATESGKSKGQFYTPAEVSRIMAEVIGIRNSKSQDETIYDPTCGSGSLLLKAADLAPHGITIYGQENDNATRALAVMNMWLHNFDDADIRQGNTMAAPQFTDDITGELKTFNYGISNPPFSYKSWMNGLDPTNDIYKRFDFVTTVPPQKNGDFAFLLHLIKSLKSNGKGCIVLPLGVLFRGNAEGTIRKTIVKKGYIKGIISLPPNLFYGTGIAASLIIIDKEDADKRDSIFMIDASHGYIKDGNKNRLREQDIHKIVDTFNKRLKVPKYSRDVLISEIANDKNDYNLNIPRYIDSQEAEDLQDIEAHLRGGIPKNDIDSLENYWEIYPSLKDSLYQLIDNRPNYYKLNIANVEIKNTIYHHPEFTVYSEQMDNVFTAWEAKTNAKIKAAKAELEEKVIAKYPLLTIDEIKAIVIEHKWMLEIEQRVRTEMDNISHRLTARLTELAERYETPLPAIDMEVNELTAKVEAHLKKMNFVW